jgi:hypothetical protein
MPGGRMMNITRETTKNGIRCRIDKQRRATGGVRMLNGRRRMIVMNV